MEEQKKEIKEPVVHYQTAWMKAKFSTYCGRKNISTNVKTTTIKKYCTCQKCLEYLN